MRENPPVLTVAVTGPTGEIGKPFIAALEKQPEVTRVIGMARRPFDPEAHGWRKTDTDRETSWTGTPSRRWSREPTSWSTSPS